MSKPIPLGPWPDREWNPILGCTMVDHTCRNCYAAARARLADANHPTIRCDGPRTFWTGKVLHAPRLWDLPLRERKPCVVFAFSQADLFHPGVSDALRDRAFEIMLRARNSQFNLLTKRVETMRDYITAWCERRAAGGLVAPMPNLRPGLSAGTQKYLDNRWPFLRDTPAALRHLSLQPLLEPITLPVDAAAENLDWVVVMREVGPGARPMKAAWVRDLRDQCDERGIPFFWETTVFDDAESVEERRRAEKEGRGYAVQGGTS